MVRMSIVHTSSILLSQPYSVSWKSIKVVDIVFACTITVLNVNIVLQILVLHLNLYQGFYSFLLNSNDRLGMRSLVRSSWPNLRNEHSMIAEGFYK